MQIRSQTVEGQRLTDYFLTLHDIIGPKPSGDPWEVMRAELEALNVKNVSHFWNALQFIKDNPNVNKNYLRAFEFGRRLKRQQHDEFDDFDKVDLLVIVILEAGLCPNSTSQKALKFMRTPLEHMGGSIDWSTVFQLINEALRSRSKKSGLNMTIYNLYKMMFKMYHNYEQDMQDDLFFDMKGEAFKWWTSKETHHVESGFAEARNCQRLFRSSKPDFKRLDDDVDARHSPLKFTSGFLGYSVGVFPPLTAFFRPKADAPWEATFSMQLLTEHIVAPPEIWQAVKDNRVDILESWLTRNPTANLEHVHETFQCCLLYSACRYGHTSCVKVLVENCSDVNSTLSSMKSTPLHAAAFFDHPEVAQCLLQHGASPDTKNGHGLSPLEEAKDNVRPVLLKASAALPGSTISPHRMMVNAGELHFGTRLDFLTGLRTILGSVQNSMEWEFTGRAVEPWDDDSGCNSIEIWKRVSEDTASMDLANQIPALAAQLTLDEVLALRIYTSPAYWPLNKFLRDLGKAHMEKDDEAVAHLLAPERTWAATALTLDVAMSKLLTVQESFGTLFRGVDGTLPTEFFIPDERGMLVMTEHGFMSTSLEPSVAAEFAQEGQPQVVLHIKCRKRDAFGYHSGVDLAWVSEFPEEKEVLFPPFTLVNIISKHRDGLKVVLTGVPTFAPSFTFS